MCGMVREQVVVYESCGLCLPYEETEELQWRGGEVTSLRTTWVLEIRRNGQRWGGPRLYIFPLPCYDGMSSHIMTH